MLKNMMRVLKDRRVFVPVSEIRERYPDADISGLTVYSFDGWPDCIEEKDLNSSLVAEGTAVRELSLTSVNTLDAEIKDANGIMPLKYMFLKNMHMTDEEISAKLGKEAEIECERILQNLSSESDVAEKYTKLCRVYLDDEEYIRKKLKRLGLSLQFLTELHNGKPDLVTFLAGRGIFLYLYPDEYDRGFWDGFEEVEDGFVFFDPFEGTQTTVSISTVTRDFSEFQPLENIGWCLRNLDFSNDFSDELAVKNGGINFSANIALVAKYLNPHAMPMHLYLNGMADLGAGVIPAMPPAM